MVRLNMSIKIVQCCFARLCKVTFSALPSSREIFHHLTPYKSITCFILFPKHHTTSPAWHNFISINSTSQRHACVRINHPRAIIVGTFSILSVIIALVTISIVKSYCTLALVLHPLVLIHWLGVHGGHCVGHGGLLEVGGGSRGKCVSWFRLDWDNFLYIILFFLIAWAGSGDLGYRGGTRALWRRHWVTFRGLSWSVNIFRGL